MSSVRSLLALGALLAAVYAGISRREATALRDSLRAARTYPGANVRRLEAVLHYP